MTEMIAQNVWLIALLPLIGGLIALIGGKAFRGWNHLPVVIGIGVSSVLSIALLTSAGEFEVVEVYSWISITADSLPDQWSLDVPIEFQIDGLTTMMLAMVTFVATLVAIFAAGYMHGDPGYPRFFFVFGLFVFSMTGLVLSNNFLLTYAFWEGVGVCSYLLVGYWYEKPSAAAAAKKAFLVNRVGDLGFAIALFLLWYHHPDHSLSYSAILNEGFLEALDPTARSWIVFFLFWAATAKSAQIPLYVWLPDAMEGPTPVSALIHAATMVTAGVYLLARSVLLLSYEPLLQVIVSIIGCLTALIAALIALTQTDLKRILAYSTVSQLGYMFMALGATSQQSELAQFAVIAAVFHLFTHAFFKALLFLCSGSVMHAMGNVIDMDQFSGLRKRLPITCWTFAVGALALAGLFPFAGFWSKDEILTSLKSAGAVEQFGPIYTAIYWVAVLTAFLTAFYTGRAFFRTFFGPEKLPTPDHRPNPDYAPRSSDDNTAESARSGDHEHDGHDSHFGHESPPIMTVPLIVLAVGATLVGAVFGPWTELFAHHVEETRTFEALSHGEHSFDWTTAILGTLAGIAGIGLSALLYLSLQGLPQGISARIEPIAKWSRRKFYVDELYGALFVAPLRVIAQLSKFVDTYVVDGLVRLIALIPRTFGSATLRPIQNGLIQWYAASSIFGLAVILFLLLFFSWS